MTPCSPLRDRHQLSRRVHHVRSASIHGTGNRPPPELRGSTLGVSDAKIDAAVLTELDDLCHRASPGPWTLSQDPGREAPDAIYGSTNAILEIDGGYFGGPVSQLICAAPTFLPALVAEVRRIRATGADRARLDRAEADRLRALLARDDLDRVLANLNTQWSSDPPAIWLGPRQLAYLATVLQSAPAAPWHWDRDPLGTEQTLMSGTFLVARMGSLTPCTADADLIVAMRQHGGALLAIVRGERRALGPMLRLLSPRSQDRAARAIWSSRNRIDSLHYSLNHPQRGGLLDRPKR